MTRAKALARPLQQVDRVFVQEGRRKLVYFAGCDYFRLASHPAILKAAREAMGRFGLGVSASRFTTGNHQLYEALEAVSARFFGAPAAVLTSGGYATNLVVAQALAGRVTHAVIDAQAHASLRDAAQALGCPVLEFRHLDPTSFAGAVQTCGKGARLLLLTDGMFPFDGAVAPLRKYAAALPSNGWMLVDDAHGAGVLGKRGRGAVEAEAVSRRRIIQTVSLAKAFGAYGGLILGAREFAGQLRRRSRQLIGATPVPLPLAAAALESMRLLRADETFRRRLRDNAELVRASLTGAGFALGATPSPIVPILPPTPQLSNQLGQALRSAGIHAPLIHYPGGPPSGYFRFVISSEHSPAQLTALARVLIDWRRFGLGKHALGD